MKRTGVLLVALGMLLFAHSAQAAWTTAKRLSWTSGKSAGPVIAVDLSDDLHVVWSDGTPGNSEIFYRRSQDGGSTWSARKRLTWTSGDSYQPAIVVDSLSHLHLVWHDATPGNREVYYKRSEDGGVTWTAAKRITWTSGSTYGPDIAIDASDDLHVVWEDNTSGEYEIYYKKSTNGGDTWTTSKRLTWASDYYEYPDIAVDGSGDLHVVWDNYSPGTGEIYYKRSTDGGTTWTTVKRLTWTSGYSYVPALVADVSGNLHVVWYDSTPGDDEIYYKKSMDGGETWAASQRLTWSAGLSQYPDLAIDPSGDLHVVWYDDAPGNYEIYYKTSTDEGDTWTSSRRLTWTSEESWDPAIAVDSIGNLHVVWEDYTPGNLEIYYKKGT